MVCWENEKPIAKAAFKYLREKLDARGRARWHIMEHNKKWMSAENAPGREETESGTRKTQDGVRREKVYIDQIIREVRRRVKLSFSVEDSH